CAHLTTVNAVKPTQASVHDAMPLHSPATRVAPPNALSADGAPMELSVSATNTLAKPTGLQRWLNRWRPSSPIRHDPLQNLLLDGRLAPGGLTRGNRIGPMRAEVLSRRVAHPLTFGGDQRLTIIIPSREREAPGRELLPPLKALLTGQG